MLIGLHGQYGSGKDTVFARLTKMFDGQEKQRLAFADKLKDSVCALLEINREQLEILKVDPLPVIFLKTPGKVGLPRGITMRTFLQRYGTEAHRDIFGTNFWVNACLPKDFNHKDKLVVVTDCRFANEAARVHELGGEVWRIIGKNDQNDGHASEQPLGRTQIDQTIINSVWDDQYVNLDAEIKMALKNGVMA